MYMQQKAEKHESSQQHQEAVALLTGAQPTVGVVFEQIQHKEADASGKICYRRCATGNEEFK